jgi:hypothetical protein
MWKSQGLLSNFYVVNLMIYKAVFALAHSKINQIAKLVDDNVRNHLNFLFKP